MRSLRKRIIITVFTCEPADSKVHSNAFSGIVKNRNLKGQTVARLTPATFPCQGMSIFASLATPNRQPTHVLADETRSTPCAFQAPQENASSPAEHFTGRAQALHANPCAKAPRRQSASIESAGGC